MAEATCVRLRVADLAATAKSVSMARELLRSWVGGHRRLDDAVLLVSETVTNAVLHGSSANRSAVVRLIVRWTGRHVYVAVIDDGAGESTPRVVADDPAAEAGRGLAIVGSIADRWGIDRARRGRRRVWFELVDR